MREPTSDVWNVMSTARTIRRFTEEPVDDATLARDRWDHPATAIVGQTTEHDTSGR